MPINIIKLGGEETPKNTVIKPVGDLKYAGKKTLKTFPRGILKTKIVGVRDPSHRPSTRKALRKQTIRLFTDKGFRTRSKTIKASVRKMKDSEVKKKAIEYGLSNGNAPPQILRELVEGSLIAGFVSS